MKKCLCFGLVFSAVIFASTAVIVEHDSESDHENIQFIPSGWMSVEHHSEIDYENTMPGPFNAMSGSIGYSEIDHENPMPGLFGYVPPTNTIKERHEGKLPLGSYRFTCIGCKQDGSLLECKRCDMRDGFMGHPNIEITDDCDFITNRNGMLKCHHITLATVVIGCCKGVLLLCLLFFLSRYMRMTSTVSATVPPPPHVAATIPPLLLSKTATTAA